MRIKTTERWHRTQVKGVNSDIEINAIDAQRPEARCISPLGKHATKLIHYRFHGRASFRSGRPAATQEVLQLLGHAVG